MKSIVFAVNEIFNPASFNSDSERKKECIRVFGEDIAFNQEIALGVMYCMGNNGEIVFEHRFRTGGWGKGPAPYGNYMIKSLVPPPEVQAMGDKADAYSQFGFGWAAVLTPLFSTDRTGLWIHCDGNIPGSLGCPVLKFADKDTNIRCWNMIRDSFEIHGTIPVTVEQRLIPRRA
jgi:hypothetical protein